MRCRIGRLSARCWITGWMCGCAIVAAMSVSLRAESVDGPVIVEIIEGIPDRKWDFEPGQAGERFEEAAMAMSIIPRKYNGGGLIVDRSAPYLVRMAARITLPPGEHEILLRSLNGARLSVDGQVVLTTRFTRPDSDGHDEVTDPPPPLAPGMRILPIGHDEQRAKLTGDGTPRHFVLEAFVGGKTLRPEIGELSVSVRGDDGPFCLMSPRDDLRVPLTDEGWNNFAAQQASRIAALSAARRTAIGTVEAQYWAWRHDLARQHVAPYATPALPAVSAASSIHNDVDRFIQQRLAESGIDPAPLIDDHAFVRRVYLDTVGVIPTPGEIDAFLAEPPDVRRARLIDRLLHDRRWADHWVSYWQDVLAENPGILKPELNNTGPFRWWLHESLLDNKPIDRMATELVMMEGSVYYGGPAGFSLATQNDVPMAEKAHILGQAFLGVEMKCARCHDAPFHDVKQQHLFSLAAMLKRQPVKLPETSSIPQQALERRLRVEVTLQPGQEVHPSWPFTSQIDEAALPEGIVRDPASPRDRMAALMTWPGNSRFAQVIANRVWARYMGAGIVEPVDDWDGARPSHPELLEYLAAQLILGAYDVKHLARLILNSHAYQRVAAASPGDRLFAAPVRRRLTAEQLVDSMTVVSGKPLGAEPLNFDPEARRPVVQFQNLGTASRAWQFTSLSNERDRPALSMPRAQSVADVLLLFGWREARQSPLTRRDDSPTVQQPAILANGLLTRRVTGLSDDSAITRMCLECQELEPLVEGLFLRILGRRPQPSEYESVARVLREGFEDRIVTRVPTQVSRGSSAQSVSWANHLNPRATTLKLQAERLAEEGGPPTLRLKPDWRQRVEDVAWALINSPEFIFVP